MDVGDMAKAVYESLLVDDIRTGEIAGARRRQFGIKCTSNRIGPEGTNTKYL